MIQIWGKPNEMRILPMSKQLEFQNREISDVQNEFFLKELPQKDGSYQYREKGIKAEENSLILFQYDNHIIAGAILLEVKKYQNPEDVYKGEFVFDPKTIVIIEPPLDADDMKKVWDDFKSFGQAPKNLDSNKYPTFINMLKERNLKSLSSPDTEKIEYRLNDVFQKGFTQNIILEGPPGTGKTYSALKVVEIGLGYSWRELQFHSLRDYTNGAWEIVQFHPNYSFEDFVRGLVAEPADQGIIFTPKDKVFAKMCLEAEKHPDAKFFLIIDEINRGDLSKVLGELIFGLEYRGSPVSLLYGEEIDEGNNTTRLVVPQNLYIIGTMNTADRSIALVDYAIRRRFSFFKMYPDRSVIENFPGYAGEAVREKALRLFDKVQGIFNDENEDYKIGHTYFLVGSIEKPGTLEALGFKYQYQVVPLLEEYAKEGILQKEDIESLKEMESCN